ncbi:hypothetical protein [Halodesulfovibrio spirochaetisodalis]|uniref:DUF883 domain-containing protein n=1 Tax=Halodesulfovibrio spirochaetisodalis TaxID=1560234 RepID=A0A1B7X9P8_9BACT|nr:hypothetical protein [Halodesulfovibrio spirochaetisodalis]OBQ46052.1 hypothetical protein SP90_14220 [Halodesulfovibrio spirochaetisodalis]
MTHEELQQEIQYLRTQLAISEAKNASAAKAAGTPHEHGKEHSVHEYKEFLKNHMHPHMPDTEVIKKHLCDIAHGVREGVKKNQTATIAGSFIIGVVVGRLLSK